MFDYAGVDRQQLYAALRIMANEGALKPAAKKTWTPENPTRNFCYVVSEWLHVYRSPAGTRAYSLVVPGDDYKHYFVRWPEGTIVDLTAEQFPDYSLIDYTQAKRASFMMSPSKRAGRLHDLMDNPMNPAHRSPWAPELI